tara:strand:+ start:642 stop:1025 length:384 start_codon:yes stop_codon:yes gene_type:complete
MYGKFNVNNPNSGSATHHGQQGPVSYVADGVSKTTHGGYASAPAELVIQNPPDHVIINGIGTYKFAYGLTGSIGTTVTAHAHQFTTAIITAEAQAVKLDISPSAWDGTGTTSPGDVTFVYNSTIKNS